MFLRPAGSGPVAHALQVFFCVVAVAIAVAKGGRKVTPLLPHPQPLGRDTELAGGFGDPVRGASVPFHISRILGARLFRYRKLQSQLIPVPGLSCQSSRRSLHLRTHYRRLRHGSNR
jgi:hypothetical protein